MREEIKKFKVARGNEKIKTAWRIIRNTAKYSNREPFWEFLQEQFGIRDREIKEIMLFLEETNELKIKRSQDGKRLYVSTLKDIKENPVKLDQWLK
ncbi:hypothetical protein E3E31_05170 [Thermococcus sp. M39]|uniref:hypothetical protein n=1 Tax=unclassified Thermococcus TaxID=2627626 RepID=UPI001438DC28|nr:MULTISPECIES: hypothetical protein [unclassified Thermococcus]NJE07916.1 hypothetical protein [Thermococcus sp. M39]NJE13374.1 hypothetical protein [Thermococcus sp. LS2]